MLNVYIYINITYIICAYHDLRKQETGYFLGMLHVAALTCIDDVIFTSLLIVCVCVSLQRMTCWSIMQWLIHWYNIFMGHPC